MMSLRRCVAVKRADRFSPNSIANDLLILQEVCARLESALGLEKPIELIDESVLMAEEDIGERIAEEENESLTDLYITMARSDEALDMLSRLIAHGAIVINSVASVRNCQRSLLDRLMRSQGIAMPPLAGTHGYWVKRGDAAAQSKNDVRFCRNEDELHSVLHDFSHRGLQDVVVSAHVPGDLVKFYGVGQRMFTYFYPSDDGISKFGDESINGMAQHYPFDVQALRGEVVRLAELTGLEIYGGDAIIDESGRFYIIDFNDWPSFSRCREEASEAIVQQVMSQLAIEC